MRGNPILQIPATSHRPTIIIPRRLIILAHVRGFALAHALLQAISCGSACGAVGYHLRDFRGGAGVLDRAVVAGAGAVMGLHETRVGDAVVCCRGADAAFGFLHHDGEDLVDVSGRCYVGDGCVGGWVGLTKRSSMLEEEATDSMADFTSALSWSELLGSPNWVQEMLM